MEKEKVTEIFLGLSLIILMIIMILLFTNVQASKSTTTISNSYNTQTYNTNSNYPTSIYNQRTSQTLKKYPTKNYNYLKYTPTYNTYNNYPTPIYNQRTNPIVKKYPTKNYNYLRYTSVGNHKRYYGVFGNEINEYKVYVRNREYKGGYFTTRFYLTDYYGKTRSESVTHYLKPNEERKFVYKNVYSDGKKYKYQNYKIVSHTRI